MKVKRTELVNTSGHLSVEAKPTDLPLQELDIASKTIPIVLRVTQMGPDLNVDGTVSLRLRETCDRCLTSYEMKIKAQFHLLLTERESLLLGKQDMDIHSFPTRQIEFDFGPVICDAIELERPMKKICTKECKGLCPSCGINLNKTQCNCEKTHVDERWAVLKELNLLNTEK